MPIPVAEAIGESAAVAKTKAKQVRNLPRYILSSMLAGAFVGVAVVLLVSVAGPLAVASNPSTKLVAGAVFGIALTLVVFAGAELFTGNVMFMLQGLMAGSVTALDLAAVWVASLVGNLIGSVAFAGLVNAGGTLQISAVPGKPGPGQAMIASLVTGKEAATGGQLFWRSVLCNMLVCLALWMAGRTKSDVAKLVVLWWALLAFIASGFEHSVANMTIFSLGIFQHSATASEFVRNMAWTIPGNIVGGGILVGAAYAYLGGKAPAPSPAVGSDNGAARPVEVNLGALAPETVG